MFVRLFTQPYPGLQLIPINMGTALHFINIISMQFAQSNQLPLLHSSLTTTAHSDYSRVTGHGGELVTGKIGKRKGCRTDNNRSPFIYSPGDYTELEALVFDWPQ